MDLGRYIPILFLLYSWISLCGVPILEGSILRLIMDSQMEKKMENGMETGGMWVVPPKKVQFWYPEILGAVLQPTTEKPTAILRTTLNPKQ